METFNFGDAINYLKQGKTIIGPNNRVYKMENGNIMCYPDITNRPKQKRVEINFKVSSILYEEWKLLDE